MKANVGVLLLVMVTGLTGCFNVELDFTNTSKKQTQSMERLWIPENNVYTPYLILRRESDAFLLLREHTTGPCAFIMEGSQNSYYAGSALDQYLNTEFASRFSEDVSKYFIKSYVTITSENSIEFCREETERIERVFFEPSWTEVTGKSNRTSPKEGELFSNSFTLEYRAATNDNEKSTAWWLRTPTTWFVDRVCCVGEDGGIGSASTHDNYKSSQMWVRPVFRVSVDIPIVFENGRMIVKNDTG